MAVHGTAASEIDDADDAHDIVYALALPRRGSRGGRALIETVLKIGGGVLADVPALDAVLEAAAAVARSRRLLIVPGGGPFADAVRDVDRRIGLSDTAAHWMAALAMDQYAHFIASRLAGAALVAVPDEISAALDAGRLPVLTPTRWLRAADPLPHSWSVTSDSIAAWIAGQVGARRLVLLKPAGVAGSTTTAVDAYFDRALPPSVSAVIVAADQIEALRGAL